MGHLDGIRKVLFSDEQLRKIHADVVDYAQIYMLAKLRKKGCEGTGELVTLREEFRDAVDALIRSCREKGCSFPSDEYDLDDIARELIVS